MTTSKHLVNRQVQRLIHDVEIYPCMLITFLVTTRAGRFQFCHLQLDEAFDILYELILCVPLFRLK